MPGPLAIPIAIKGGELLIAGGIAATGAFMAWWYGAGGAEQTQQATGALANSIANSMSGADEEAETKLDSGTAAATCATGNCPPPPECTDIIAKIKELANELAKRRADMLADRPVSQGGLGMYELFLKDPLAKVPDPRGIKSDLGNWEGHGDQITEKQTQIKRELKKHKEKKCGALPTGAETQSELPPPERPFGY